MLLFFQPESGGAEGGAEGEGEGEAEGEGEGEAEAEKAKHGDYQGCFDTKGCFGIPGEGKNKHSGTTTLGLPVPFLYLRVYNIMQPCIF